MAGCVFVSSCTTGATLERQAETIRTQLQSSRLLGAYVCAPEALARAEANLVFLELELAQGNSLRADEHNDIAREALATVIERSKVCRLMPPDRDQDTVPDDDDACPDVAGVVALAGCPDRDQDRIADAQDRCPDVPEDYDGVEDTDGCPDVGDQDGDGILDPEDRCPQAAEDVDQWEDEDGCPDPDNDADGIPDANDRCPLEPETANDFEDQDGCPDKKLDLVEVKRDIGKIEIKEMVYFETGRATIRSVSYAVLGQVAEALKSLPDIKVVVEGHTDSVGAASTNLSLSQHRAEAVREYLVEQGVEPERLTAIGFGEARPLDTNRTRKGREHNRRVEFSIVADR
ncbi:MAG: OmpA family protein [Deltaproteobacteria bacterium]|nr:OmpA family protein [Deltaproteobacteria bacterium]